VAGGSDEQVLSEAAAFWQAHDAAETEAEKQSLTRAWHRAHGGMRRWDPDLGPLLEGGLEPPRVP
jgi:hypothetical protein